MSYWQATLLGLFQGLTEFLPVSSSAHLALAPWLFGFKDPGLTYDLALHVGTLAAAIAAFGARWLALLGDAAREPRGEGGRRLGMLALATVPAVAAGVLLEDAAETRLRDPRLIACTLLLFSFVMEAADRLGARARAWTERGWGAALAVGCAQALALVPGVSRSGATMSAGLALGFTRESAAELSFLMSVPIIAGAAALKLRHLSIADVDGPFVWGVIVSGVTGWLAVKGFLRGLARWGLRPYVVYRCALALLVLSLGGR